MKFALTKQQVARGSRPDAVLNDKMYLIKSCTALKATYQIRLLLFRAVETGTKLVLDLPKSCALSDSLKKLVKEHKRYLEVQRR